MGQEELNSLRIGNVLKSIRIGYKSSFWTQFKRQFDWLDTLDIFAQE